MKPARQATSPPRSIRGEREFDPRGLSVYPAPRQPEEDRWGVQACELVFERTFGEATTRSCLGGKQAPRRNQSGQSVQKVGSTVTLYSPALPNPRPLPPSPPRPSELSLHLEGQRVLCRQAIALHQHKHLASRVSWNDSAKNLAIDDVSWRFSPKLVRATVAFGG